MAELKCNAEQCTWNKDHLCSKGDIQVGGKHAGTYEETCCESFAMRGENAYTSSIARPSKMISIDCEAEKCMYNENYKCVASHVDIRGCSACQCKDTACATFSDK